MTLRDRLAAIVEPLPPGAAVTLPVEAVRAWIEEEGSEVDEPTPPPSVEGAPESWREKLWIVPAETRIGIGELAEALNRSRSWIYKRTMANAGPGRIPHRKLDGELVFVVGEIRAWIRDREDAVHEGPMESTDIERDGWSRRRIVRRIR